jgi:subtilisin family serine protease
MRLITSLAALLVLGCAPSPREKPPTPPVPRVDPAPASRAPVLVPGPEARVERIAPPEAAYARGWMPLASTGVDRFVREHRTYDGRGVLIAILDTGVDPGAPGLRATSTGDPKLVDVRDFSGEGAVTLARLSPRHDTVEIGGRKLGGFGRVVGLNTTGPYYGGTLRELALGVPPASDLDGDGEASDTLAVVVTRALDGWVVLADTDGDGSLAGERPVRDYLVGRETLGWAPRGRVPRVNLAANFAERAGEPVLDLYFALDAHGTHVAGIAAAHDLYGVTGFDGVAPGAQLLGLKISNRANGSVSSSGAILAAMDHAVRFAAARRQPLVINLSFGVGNEREGEARIDGLVDSVLALHPGIVLTVSAGNDGPGLSTIGFPGSAGLAISVGATIPSVFLPPDGSGTATDIVADFSARGGELAKPDILAPGVAYSSVPLWNAGDEVKQGTSMAAPHAAGLAALLLSALAQEEQPVQALTLRQALMVTARPAPEGGYLDEGRGVPDVDAAYRWLIGGGRGPGVEVGIPGRRTSGGWVVAGPGVPRTGAQRFEVRRPPDAAPVTYTLRGNVPWLTGPPTVTLAREVTSIELRYSADGLAAPGAYTGVVSGWPPDTLAGPGFRLVTTIVVPAAVADTTVLLRRAAPVRAGDVVRSFFAADSARPFEVRISSGLGQRGLAHLHEPGGAPYREIGTRPLGVGADGAVYRVDARDVVRGDYQVVASSMPGGRMTVTAVVSHAPFTIVSGRTGEIALADLANRTGKPVTAGIEFRLRGGQREVPVRASGGAIQRIPFEIPAWATGLEVDVAMDRGQWGRFTDFGVTVLDSAGRQIAQDPLEYAFGRLSTALPDGHGPTRAQLTLFPGLADPADDQPWTVDATIRLYADSSVTVAPATPGTGDVTIAAGGSAAVRFQLPPAPWPLPEGFAPLGVFLARAGGQVWTREDGFAERSGR